MAKKYWQTAEFRKLKRDWYKKLEEDGFKDIEDNRYGGDENLLKEYSNYVINTNVRAIENLGTTYYSMAAGWCWHGTFDSDRDRFIWEQHAGGSSERTIAKELPLRGFKKLHRSNIGIRIRAMKQRMIDSVWYRNYEYDGYLSPYDTSVIIYGDPND